MDYINKLKKALQENKLSREAFSNIIKWMSEEEYKDFRKDILNLIKSKNWHELQDAFYRILPFGTGGRRGKMGAGPNRMNSATVSEGAQGLRNFLKKKNKDKKISVVIAYDTRRNSKKFANIAANTFQKNGVNVHIFNAPRPTPELSFAIKHLKADAGIVISASHNPPSDNGFKAYNSLGSQYIYPEDVQILKEVEKAGNAKLLAEKKGNLNAIKSDLDKKYVEAVLNQSPLPKNFKPDFSLVYSALNGTGIKSVYPVLEKAGFNIHKVAKQCVADPDFKTIADNFPNPELLGSYDLALKEAADKNDSFLVTSDPDADRIGVMFKNKKGKFIYLDGNAIGSLITFFILSEKSKKGKLNKSDYIVKTLVTSDLISAIARSFGVRVIGYLPVGIKYIADTINKESNKNRQLIFGGEESHGFIAGNYIREKDSAVAALLISQYAAALKKENKTLEDALNEIYLKYGYFYEAQQSIRLKSSLDTASIKDMLDMLKSSKFKKIGDIKIYKKIDSSKGEAFDFCASKMAKTYKENSLTLLFDRKGENKITIRPSGTEPKIKIYVSLMKSVSNAKDLETAKHASREKSKAIFSDLKKSILNK